MKRSVRWKFTIIFAGLMTVAIALIWCINNWFLSGYYQNYKIHTLEKGYRAIDAIIQDEVRNGESSLEDAQAELNSGWKEYQKSKDGSSDMDSADGGSAQSGKNGTDDRAGDETQDALGEYAEGDTVVLEDDSEEASADALDGEEASSGGVRLANVIRELRDRSNISLLLYDSESDQTLVSSARDVEVMRNRVRRYIVGHAGAKRDVLREYDNYMIQKTFDPLSKTFYLESWGFFSDNATIFIMTMPMESIHESAAISNRFLMFVGIVVILAGSILIYFITRHITMPIKRLSELSEKMSNLDFDARYETSRRSTEEIDTLGNSMNVLSERLKTTIGELKEANAQLKKDIDEKVQIDEMRKEFIANVSHELKTPIALIQGYAEGLKECINDDPESREFYCEVIMDESSKMNQMVKKLLTLNQLEFGNDVVTMERFDLVSLVKGVIQSASILAQQKEAKLLFNEEEPVYVWADEFKVEEVVTNYISNALNHLEGDKVIDVKLIHEPGNVIRTTVFNTGKPIPEEDLDKIWIKFYKVDKARTREYGGSGIGLSIVKAIMDSFHQKCGVKNYDNGVEFWFELDGGEKCGNSGKDDQRLLPGAEQS